MNYGGQVYEGEHERIVDDEIWNQVQTTLSRNGRRGGRNVGNKHGALLKGLVRCATCDVGMIHTYVKKKNRVYRYYVCVKAHQRGWAQCETRSVSAPALESAVLDQLRGIGRNPTFCARFSGRSKSTGSRTLRRPSREKADAESELKSVAQEMGGVVSMAGKAEFATDRLADLQDRVDAPQRPTGRNFSQQLAAIDAEHADPRDVEAALQEFDPLWEQLSTWEQERFIRTLVEQVRYDGKTGTVTLGFRSQRDQGLVQLGAGHQGEIRACTTAQLKFSSGCTPTRTRGEEELPSGRPRIAAGASAASHAGDGAGHPVSGHDPARRGARLRRPGPARVPHAGADEPDHGTHLARAGHPAGDPGVPAQERPRGSRSAKWRHGESRPVWIG